MKAAVWKKKGVLEVDEAPIPEVGDDEVKVKVEYCAICGSDPHIVSGVLPVARPPRIIGHEMSGTVVEVGKNVKKVKVGDRVSANPVRYCGSCYYCRNGQEHYCLKLAEFFPQGAFAEYIVWHEQQMFKLPDVISFEEGTFTEPVSVTLHGIDIANVRPGNSLALLGAGPIGLLLLQLALKAGVTMTLVSEPIASKRKLAQELGADIVVDPNSEDLWQVSRKATEYRGFDTVIEASGAAAAANEAMNLAKNCGTVVYFAVYPMNFSIPLKPFDLYAHELTLKGVFMSPYTFPRSIDLLPHLELKKLITDTFPLEEINKAFELHETGEPVKILIKC